MARFLAIFAIVILVIGLARPWLTKLGLGRLPGDITIGRGRFTIHFPIMTSIVVSLVLSVVLTWLNR
jgi:hypothetical protein